MTEIVEKEKVYLSFDIEADGQSPAYNSMLSLGIVGFKTNGDEVFEWQKNLKPEADKHMEQRCWNEFWSKHPEQWKFVNTNQVSVEEGMLDLSAKLKELNKTYKFDWVARPSAYDWQWLKYNYEKTRETHADMFNIGYTAKCLSALWWSYCKRNKLTSEQKNTLWKKLEGDTTVTHNSLDDARAQGRVFVGLMKLDGIF
uniref:Exonuclease domain-containing protein n=1 Tax=viral metagenome TaxID=1070528 RepID=A0A6C0EB13_9ZZZZ